MTLEVRRKTVNQGPMPFMSQEDNPRNLKEWDETRPGQMVSTARPFIHQ
jgi:hypothetical protein